MLLLLCVRIYASDEVRFGPPPEWVEVARPESLNRVTEHSSGVAYDLCDNQAHVERGEDYTHVVVRILSEAGRDGCGELRFSFAPSYQTLTLHHLRILRGGQLLDRLDPTKVKVLRREQNAEQGLYDGHLTALLIVEDLRVGDVLDYAMSLQGQNPVFAGKYSDSWTMQGVSPVQRLRVRLVLPKRRHFQHRAMGPAGEGPAIKHLPGAEEWIWDKRDVGGLDYEYGAPAWIMQYPIEQVSEHPDWASVVKWGADLYPLDAELPGELETFANSLRSEKSEKAVLAALHRVQSDIRYLSLSLGESSHRPHSPKEIFQNRFGDCKDKALLLAVLLRRMGFDAVPTFVNTTMGKGLADWLPSGKMFDHVIVHLRFEGVDYWLDPTRLYQAGGLADHSVTNLGWALPLRLNGPGLCRIVPTERTMRRMQTEEGFVSVGNTKPVDLNVKQVYRGASAEGMRAYLADKTKDRVGRDAINRYLRVYPSIRQRKEPDWTDDKASNTITLEETYSLPDFWKLNDVKTGYRCEVSPQLLNEMIEAPERPSRTTPLDYGVPFEIDSRIYVQLHNEIPVTPISWTEKTEAFDFKKSTNCEGSRFEIAYHYKTTADQVPSEKIAPFIEQLTRIRGRLGYNFTVPVDGMTSFTLNWSGLFILMIFGGASVYLAVRIFRWKPSPARPAPISLDPLQNEFRDQYVGLGGWLILVGIGLFIGTIANLVQLPGALKSVLDLRIWNNVTTPGSPAYNQLYAPLLFGEAAYHLMRTTMLVLATILYFRTHWFFPRLMIIIIAVSPILGVLDIWAVSFVTETNSVESAKTYAGIFQGVVAAAIWIPYYSVSKRVKATFVK